MVVMVVVMLVHNSNGSNGSSDGSTGSSDGSNGSIDDSNGRKMGSTIQYHNSLATLPNHFCTAFCHSMPTRSKIEQRSCQQT